MRKIVLHIGTEKTGTTSIQSFLSANRERISKQGFLVPDFLGGDCHRKLSVMAFNEEHSDDFVVGMGLVDPEVRRSTIKVWREEFERKVRESEQDGWIVSCEHLQSRLKKGEEVERLGGILDGLFDEVEVVLYIRKPIDGAVSLWSTAIRAGGKSFSVPPPSNDYYDRIFNHRNTIKTWSSTFPGRVRVRLYEKTGLKAGSLIEDFCEVAGIGFSDEFSLPAFENETLSWHAMKVLAELNRRIPRIENQQMNPIRGDLANYVADHFSGFPKYVPSAGEIADYDAHFAESDEWVRSEFFPDREKLWRVETPPRIDADDPKFSKEFTSLENAFVNTLARIWEDKMGRIVRLEREMCQDTGSVSQAVRSRTVQEKIREYFSRR